MMKNRTLLVLAGLVVVALMTQSSAVFTQTKAIQDDTDSVLAVKKYLAGKGGAGPRAQFSVPMSKSLKTLFPDLSFVSVRYPQFPLAVQPPKGLQSSNVFVVTGQGAVEHFGKSSDMTNYFFKQLQKRKLVFDKKLASHVVQAWLAVQQEFVQDGFFAFEILKPDVSVDDQGTIQAVGRSLVTKGGNGEIKITMQFGSNGSIKMQDNYKIRRGPRPKCQATKLLDDDPIVRYMAENELLYMGTAARGYLLDQRSKASPRLRRAITRILNQIEESGW